MTQELTSQGAANVADAGRNSFNVTMEIKAPPHITVCICTYKRPDMLKRALEALRDLDSRDLESDGQFTYSIVVVDNDRAESGRAVAEAFAASSPVKLKYCPEPQPGIARARNCAVANATGEFLAFIDDDEFANPGWLRNLLETQRKYQSDGVLAPVDPYFDAGAPQWVIDGGFYKRPVHPSGMVLTWAKCRTGNVLLKRELFAGDDLPFRPECISGEDQDFFRRQIEQGHIFHWCHEAAVLEVVPPVRWKRGFLMRRALLRGIFAQRNHGLQPLRLLQAVVSVPVYAVALPLALAFGQARFMTCVFKLSYHLGRLFGLFGFNPVGQQYVSD
jgi:succinoglycan biosynthesis protein ExoM